MLDAFEEPLRAPAGGDFAEPEVGDLFVITTDGQDRGVILVAAVFEDPFVFGWVVTPHTDQASFPAFHVETDELGKIAIWPESEFGVSTAALGRRVGHLLSPKWIHFIRLNPSDSELENVVDFYAADESTGALEHLSQVVQNAWELGSWRWPTDELGSLLLVDEFARKIGMKPETISRRIDARPKRTADLLNGYSIPSEVELANLRSLLSGTFDADPMTYLRPITESSDAQEQAPVYSQLSSPSYKPKVEQVMRNQDLSEIQSRNLIWQKSVALAARQDDTDPQTKTRHRIEHAISSILDE